MKKQLMIGLGTGRCGTVSLYRLLNYQKNSNISHESKPILKWEFDAKAIEIKLSAIMNKKGTYVGDVASYYLPYVGYILKKYPETKFVCLKRPKEEVVKSFTKHTNRWNWNHWINHYGNKWKKAGEWDDAFPKYNLDSKEEALGRYWEDYYKEIKRLMKKYPRNIKVFQTTNLNNKSKVKELLNFCNIEEEDQEVIVNIKDNRFGDRTFSTRYFLWRANKIR